MLCPVDLTAALVLALIYPFLCPRHKAQARKGLRLLWCRVSLLISGPVGFLSHYFKVIHKPTRWCDGTCIHPKSGD
jgi:hypothetical protein